LDIAFFSNLIQQHLASAKHEDIISSIWYGWYHRGR
jgi:hypothetical protein